MSAFCISSSGKGHLVGQEGEREAVELNGGRVGEAWRRRAGSSKTGRGIVSTFN